MSVPAIPMGDVLLAVPVLVDVMTTPLAVESILHDAEPLPKAVRWPPVDPVHEPVSAAAGVAARTMLPAVAAVASAASTTRVRIVSPPLHEAGVPIRVSLGRRRRSALRIHAPLEITRLQRHVPQPQRGVEGANCLSGPRTPHLHGDSMRR